MHQQAPPSLRELLARNGYEYVRHLGQGGFGVVYLVNEKLTNGTSVPRAVKRVGELPVPTDADLNVILSRASKEADTIMVASQRTKYLVRVLRFFTDHFDERLWGFFVMEYIAGGDLAKWLEKRGQVAVPDALRIVRHISLALQAIQADKVVHRDIKPGNIMVAVRDGEEDFLLADFSLMRTLDGTSGFSNFGSAGYLSPEQANPRDFGSQGYPVDIYALGSVLYKVLTGKPAIDARNKEEYLYRVCNEDPKPMSARRPELARWRGLDELGLAMTARNQRQRPTVGEVLSRLPRIVNLDSEQTKPRPRPAPAPSPGPVSWKAGVGVVGVALLAGTGYISLGGWTPDPPPAAGPTAVLEPTSPRPSEEFNKLLQKAEEMLNNDDPTEAIRLAGQAQRMLPGEAAPGKLIRRAEQRQQQQQAAQQRKTEFDGWMNKATKAFEAGNLAEAKRMAAQAQKLLPQDTAPKDLIARIGQREQQEQAARQRTEYLSLMNRAENALKAGDLAQAQDFAQRAQRLQPNEAAPQTLLQRVGQQQRQQRQQAAARQRADFDGLMKKGEDALKAGNPALAISLAEQAQRLLPDEPSARDLSQRAQQRQQQQQAAARQRADYEGFMKKAEDALKSGRPAEAQQFATQAQRLFPNETAPRTVIRQAEDAQFRALLAGAEKAIDSYQYTQGQTLVRQAEAIRPKDPKLLDLKARLERRMAAEKGK